MGKTGIRTVGKVSFDKLAAEQANIHVRHVDYNAELVPGINIPRQE